MTMMLFNERECIICVFFPRCFLLFSRYVTTVGRGLFLNILDVTLVHAAVHVRNACQGSASSERIPGKDASDNCTRPTREGPEAAVKLAVPRDYRQAGSR